MAQLCPEYRKLFQFVEATRTLEQSLDNTRHEVYERAVMDLRDRASRLMCMRFINDYEENRCGCILGVRGRIHEIYAIMDDIWDLMDLQRPTPAKFRLRFEKLFLIVREIPFSPNTFLAEISGDDVMTRFP